jgi:hypothetical protein
MSAACAPAGRKAPASIPYICFIVQPHDRLSAAIAAEQPLAGKCSEEEVAKEAMLFKKSATPAGAQSFRLANCRTL